MILALSGTETGYQGIRADWTLSLSCPEDKATPQFAELIAFRIGTIAITQQLSSLLLTPICHGLRAGFSRPTTELPLHFQK